MQNAHGDVVNLTDTEGAVTKTYRYDAFGLEFSPVSGDVNVFRYCGEYFDAETGTVYLRARYYQASIGRFTQRDTVAGKIGDPLSLNLYTYCHNNPLLYLDPSGNRIIDLGKGWSARIDAENGKVQRHVHVYKNGNKFAQNADGSPHDNSKGSPPSGVLEELNRKTKWDWKKKEKEYEEKEKQKEQEEQETKENKSKNKRKKNMDITIPDPYGIDNYESINYNNNFIYFPEYSQQSKIIIGSAICASSAFAIIWVAGNDVTGVGVGDDALLGPLTSAFGYGLTYF